MREQKRIITSGPLLDKNGTLSQCGYATEAILRYRRSDIKAPPWRIKEWDFYQVSNDNYCVQFTIGHTSYAGALTVTFFCYDSGLRYDKTATLILPFGSLNMPSSASKGIEAKHAGVGISFDVSPGKRVLRCKTEADKKTPAMESEIVLSQPYNTSLVIATPFKEYAQAFYYNEKINCMPAEGYISIGAEHYNFEPESSFGLLDWGRGVWPFHAKR